MINYTPQNQLSLDMFKNPFEKELRKDNRWVILAEVIPWDDLAAVYSQKLKPGSGRKSVNIRLVIAAIIVKHKLNLDDRGTVAMIQENMYIQYFCGYSSFNPERPFDPSLFVDIRKRLGNKEFDEFNKAVIESSEELKPKRSKIITSKAKSGSDNDGHDNTEASLMPNKGKLKLDSTIADQEIPYPTDLKLLNASREELERLIDLMHQVVGKGEKPRTYRRVARKSYLNISKKKNKGNKLIRKGIKSQLQFVRRDLKIVDGLYNRLKEIKTDTVVLEKKDRQLIDTIHEIYRQQLYMYKNKVNSHSNRIINIYQPWIRPMPRGKDGSKTEFGSKINVSEVDGFSRVNRLDWNNYNEGVDLKGQVESYKEFYGRYPKVVLADQIYLNRENRKYLKSKEIEIIGKPLGRPPKIKQTSQQKWKKKKLAAERNHVEGKFGQAKRGYGLNNIKARLSETSESWIAAIFFVMNLTKLVKMADRASVFYSNLINWMQIMSMLLLPKQMITKTEINFIRQC